MEVILINFQMLSKIFYNKDFKQLIMDIEIFADETITHDKNGKEYLGIGCLFVPTCYKYRLSKKLSNMRCLNSNSQKWTWNYKDCKNLCKERYHNINNFEIHYSEIDKSVSKFKLEIYEQWIKFVVKHNKHQEDRDKLLYFQILYLDLDKLDFDTFGVTKDITNIYNRFFRTVILSAKSYFFKDCDFTIKNIYHDNADNKQTHDYFDWHSLDYLKRKRINVKTDKIKFISSNHNDYDDFKQKENAQFIQLVDLILGCSNQILFMPSKNKNKIKIASAFYPLFKRLWRHPYNRNSSFNYFKSQQVSIFPRTSINSQKDLDGYSNDVNQFHHNLEITDPESLIEQNSLDKWF